ncbi:MAG: family 10 glycosylhydrolase, partial [Planctomycetota bacterium]
MNRVTLFAGLFCATTPLCALASSELPHPPAVEREFRAAWIATVANIDWPSKPGLNNDELRAELGELLDLCVELNLNAVVLQVRPACDAIYASRLEPWSEFLTGRQGEAPADGFDPLAWACGEAHDRGLELHAWFNPYRATHPSAKGPLDSGHIAARRPQLAPQYGKHRWLDPGSDEAAQHSIDVVMDVVRRYDVDAVHFDDYFYPYPVKSPTADASNGLGADATAAASAELPFPDDASWQAYCDATPEPERLTRNDWRRDNVNRFIQRLGDAIHAAKPHVRFGISPFGIWRPGVPQGIQGFDQYDKLYADARLWIREGWVDYLSPQLYWAIDQKPQSFTTLLSWWSEQNPTGRNLWPGLYTSKLGGEKPKYKPQEIVRQIEATRRQRGADGHIHFSIKALQRDWGGAADMLKRSVYAEPALVPASPWLAGDEPPPAAPSVQPVADRSGAFRLDSPDRAATRWVLQKLVDGEWTAKVIGASTA